MNKRIEQLAKEASHQSPDGYPVTIPYSKDFAEKFAELIVRECDEFVSMNFNDQGMTLGHKMKKHFGIEDNYLENIDGQ